MAADAREFRLRPLAITLNLLATVPFIVGGPLLVVLSTGEPFPTMLGGSLCAIGVYLAIRVPLLAVRWDDHSLSVVGAFWSRTIPRHSIEAVSTDIERPSITWVTEGGARLRTPLSVLRSSSSSLVPLAARKRRADALERIARWADGSRLPESPSDTPAPERAGLRRRWRQQHRPPIRRSDPVWEIAGWIAPIVALFAILSGFGLARRSPILPVETSATMLTVEAGVIVVLLLAVTLRRLRGSTPDRYPRLMLSWTAFATTAAAITIWLRDTAETAHASLLPVVLCGAATTLSLILLASAPRDTRPGVGGGPSTND
jgi:hypothetical protein